MATRHHRSLSFPPHVSHHRNHHHRHPRFITVKVEASISIYDGATEESLFIADTVITIPLRVYHRHDRRPHEIDFYRMATSFIWEKLVTINALFSSQRASLLRSMATELSTILESISFLLPLQQHQRDVNMIMYAQLYEYHRSSTSLRHEVFVSSILEDGNLHYHTFNIEPLHEFGIQEVRLFNEEDEYQYIPKPADPQAIENLERINAVDWLSTSSSSDQDEQYCNSCSICLEKLVGEDINEDGAQAEDPTEVLVLIRMPCNHLFHEGCILGWLMNNHVCPLCRYEIPAASTQENIPSAS